MKYILLLLIFCSCQRDLDLISPETGLLLVRSENFVIDTPNEERIPLCSDITGYRQFYFFKYTREQGGSGGASIEIGEDLELNPGSYTITDFVIQNQNRETMYAYPASFGEIKFVIQRIKRTEIFVKTTCK